LLDEVSAPLPEGMWLTRIRPLSSLPGMADTPASGSAAKATSANRIVGLELEGIGYTDRIKSEAIGAYRDQLRESNWFSPKTEITWQPVPRADAGTMEFKIFAVLKEPQEL
jgi:hypothetical protein